MAGPEPTPLSVLLCAPEYIAKSFFGLTVEYPQFYPGNPDVAGFLDRDKKLVGVVSTAPLSSQRFTLAHELGHYVLHTDSLAFRDRSLSAPDVSRERPPEEREADAFAAELLMPRKLVARVFQTIFGDGSDPIVYDGEFVEALSMSGLQRLNAFEIAGFSSVSRAQLIARLRVYKGRVFQPLADQFQVSATAMGIQLVQCGIVR